MHTQSYLHLAEDFYYTNSSAILLTAGNIIYHTTQEKVFSKEWNVVACKNRTLLINSPLYFH